jgi:hypothetical protein
VDGEVALEETRLTVMEASVDRAQVREMKGVEGSDPESSSVRCMSTSSSC